MPAARNCGGVVLHSRVRSLHGRMVMYHKVYNERDPMREPSYRIIHITDLLPRAQMEEQRLGFGWCSGARCSESSAYVVFTDVLRTGRVRLQRKHLCARHAAQWCQAHNLDIAAVPSITFWDDRDLTRPTPFWSPEQLPMLHL